MGMRTSMADGVADRKSFNRKKRLIDVALVVVTAPVTIPVGVVTAGLVRVFLGSPVLFKQKRIGLNEQPFEIMKFRTMLPETERSIYGEDEVERQTQFGNVLRKLSLDEIPQLLNVLRGDMAIIGPRPLLEHYLPYYKESEKARHSVRPGITGAAQVNGRNNLGWDEKLNYDAEYARTATLRDDAHIVLHTIGVVLGRDGVLPEGQLETEPLDDYRIRTDQVPSSEDDSKL
ncbi:sugar transferase [Corynebacterium lubricantis]|uniref:sugar transferase n=1 Tax=Corynebacterium lubricantis TaxID=541095 RepID=UPI000A01BB23|nr:sugar transferase [Corynebacterium lubricantis]